MNSETVSAAAPIMHNLKCLVKDCANHAHEGAGVFVTMIGIPYFICAPCYQFMLQGTTEHNMLVSNAVKLLRNTGMKIQKNFTPSNQFYFGGYDTHHGGYMVLRDYRGEEKQRHIQAWFVVEVEARNYVKYANKMLAMFGDAPEIWEEG